MLVDTHFVSFSACILRKWCILLHSSDESFLFWFSRFRARYFLYLLQPTGKNTTQAYDNVDPSTLFEHLCLHLNWDKILAFPFQRREYYVSSTGFFAYNPPSGFYFRESIYWTFNQRCFVSTSIVGVVASKIVVLVMLPSFLHKTGFKSISTRSLLLPKKLFFQEYVKMYHIFKKKGVWI
jgi:hypothetical protein